MAPPRKELLSVLNIQAGYGEYTVLHDLSINVNLGELVAIIGPNGAGKTTLLKAIMGIIKPRRGEIVFEGTKINWLPSRAITKMGIGYVPQGAGTFPQMSVYENIESGAYILNDRELIHEKIEDVLQLFPRLRERIHMRAFSLSGGERQMLLLGRALMLSPKLLLLDEPSLGLDPKSQAQLYSTITKLHREGKAILLVEQNIHQALRVADRCYVLEVGREAFEGEPSELTKSDRIKSTYLGM